MSKRDRYSQFLSRAESIPKDVTIIKAIVVSKIDKASAGDNPTAYVNMNCIYLGDDDVEIGFKHPGKLDAASRDAIDAEREGEALPVLKNGATFHGPSFSKNAASLKPGDVIKLGVHSSWYQGRYTIKIAAVILNATGGNTMSPDMYDGIFKRAGLTQIPTIKNIGEFVEDEDEIEDKYVRRPFVAPLTVFRDSKDFKDVAMLIKDEDAARYVCAVKDSVDKTIGINEEFGENTRNQFQVVYVLPNDYAISMTYAFNSKDAAGSQMFGCFGVLNVTDWSKVAPRMLLNAKEFLVFGSANKEDLLMLPENLADSDEGGDSTWSRAYINSMQVNLRETVRAAGLPLSFEFVTNNFLIKEKWAGKAPDDTFKNPVNHKWSDKMEAGEEMICNVTDLTGNNRLALSRETFPDNYTVEFFGVFSMHDKRPYKLTVDTESFAHEKDLTEGEHMPVVVFMIGTPQSKSAKVVDDAAVAEVTEALASQSSQFSEEEDN